MSVIVAGEYVALLDPSHDNVLKDIRNVYTGRTWDGVEDSRRQEVSQAFKNVPLAFQERPLSLPSNTTTSWNHPIQRFIALRMFEQG